MALKLDELEKKGAFPAERLIKRTVSWEHVDENGEEITDTFDIFVKCLSVSEFESFQAEENKGKNFTAFMISECLRLGDKGEEVIEYEKARQLDGTLANCLFTDIMSVMGMGSKEAKKSSPAKKSGTS